MFKRTLIAASLTVAALASAQAMAVTGGGATLPAALYKGSADSILPASFSYAAVGSGAGKIAFLTNNPAGFSTTGTVHFAGSDSILNASELSTYKNTYNASYGPLIQLPSVATSVAIPYKKAGQTALNLTSAQLCEVFSGQKTTWGALLGTSDATTIRVVYRNVSSGTSEILTRHLNSVCPTQFATNSTFTSARIGGIALPSNWVGVANTSEVATAVNAVDGSIGYVGPDGVDATSNAVVARVNGVQPTALNVTLALSSVNPPANAIDAADPSKWSPVVANPTSGYKLAAYTNFIFGQCYKDATVAAAVKAFLTQHYSNPGNNTATQAHKFVAVPNAWKTAVTANFITNTSGNNLDINNASVCNAIGRPL
ncbi:protein disulfide reductase [Pseudomonas fluorescens]|jgi:ABC-type phosphate transport system substrate-binding protein|uniref:Phosphate-binding protein PstS n=1 Tax=Pseudomonas fluorescens TaxID=294 RepID=A0A854WY84_PSEFL|nr:substrate-binding domain-containing protein [Pseudomonas fluorescens]PCM46573.1 protein disulfide reductase [Pseudomonas fluorescens]